MMKTGFGKRIFGAIALLVVVIVIGFVVFLRGPQDPPVTEETMEKIQANLQQQILVVLSKRNEITNAKFEKFNIKDINPRAIRVDFTLSYDEPLAEDNGRILREGSIVLKKIDQTVEEQVWVAEKVDVAGEQINFENGLLFKASDEEAAADSETSEVEPEAGAAGEAEAK